MKQIKKIIDYIENKNTPFLNYILIFLASVSLRNFLEIFSDQAKIFFRLFPPSEFLFFSVWQGLSISLLHYYTYWIALFLALAIIFSAILKENIIKVIKALFSFSIILNITPLLDLLVSPGKDANISYLYPKAIFEFLLIPKGLTPGMILTSITAICLSFIYCRVKSNSLKNGFLGGLALYAMLMITSMLPLILKAHNPIPIIRFLLICIFLEILFIFYFTKKDVFLGLLKDISWQAVFHFVLMFFLGITLVNKLLFKLIRSNLDSFLLSVSGIFLGWVAATMFNNLEDYKIYRVNNTSRSLIGGKILPAEYRMIALGSFFLAAALALGVNFQTFFFILVLTGNSFLYSLPPLRLKRIPVFSKVFISLGSLIIVMLGFSFAGGEILSFPVMVSIYFLIFITLAISFIDLKNYETDKQDKIPTLPVLLGLKKAKVVISGFILSAYLALAWIFLDLRLFIPSLILGGLQLFLINKKRSGQKWIFFVYLVSVLLLIYYLWLINNGYLVKNCFTCGRVK